MKHIFTSFAVMAACVFGMSAQNNGSLVKVANAFPGKVIASVGEGANERATYTYNDNGQLIELKSEGYGYTETLTFDYSGGTYGDFVYDAKYVENDGWSSQTVYVKVNDQGFATEMWSVDEDREGVDIETAVCKYDAEGHLVQMIRNEDTTVTTMDFTWTGGDIVKTVSTEVDPEYGTDMDTYITEYDPQLLNTSGFMAYETFTGADIDQFEEAYLAGMLGKATAHLPIKMAEQGDDEYETFAWVLDADGYPVKFSDTEVSSWGGYTQEMEITWQTAAGISSVAADAEGECQWYDIRGVRHNAPVSGFNIMRKADGSVVKVRN